MTLYITLSNIVTFFLFDFFYILDTGQLGKRQARHNRTHLKEYAVYCREVPVREGDPQAFNIQVGFKTQDVDQQLHEQAQEH